MKQPNKPMQYKIILIILIFLAMLVVLFTDLILAGVVDIPGIHTSKDKEKKDAGQDDQEYEEEEETAYTTQEEENTGSVPEVSTEIKGTYINISKEELTLDTMGEEEYLNYTTDLYDESQIEWNSDDPGIVKVSSDGMVTAISEGVTYVSASCGKLQDRCKIICEFAKEEKFILPDSSNRYLSISDISYLSKEELRLARNEIYAKHGRLFKDKELQRYFNSQDWYEGRIQPDDFNESVLNSYEKKNTELIDQYEKQMGYR